MNNRKLSAEELREILLDPDSNADLAHCRMWMVINNLVRVENDLRVAEDAYSVCDQEKEKHVRMIKNMLITLREELNYIAEL